MLFATSDYGTAVAIVLLIYAAWFIVILIAGIGSWCCIRLLREEGDVPEARRFGITLLLICASLPLGCCIGPSLLHYANYGRFPMGKSWESKLTQGMSKDEVTVALGMPHRTDGDRWYYYVDACELVVLRVNFGWDGKVTSFDTL